MTTFAKVIGDARLVTLAAVSAASIALWWMMFSAGMRLPADCGSAGVFSTALMWVLMMLAMMLPAMAPVVSVYAGLVAKEEQGPRLAARIGAFFAGYAILWIGFALALALAQLWLRDSVWFTLGGTLATPLAAGGLLLAAGAYQLTGLKDRCLKQCDSPVAFLLRHWREGLRGAFPMGLTHGWYCIGCCAALMLLMFVFGTMNPIWMAVIALYLLAEKIVPAPRRWGRWVGLALILAGIATISANSAWAKAAETGETAEIPAEGRSLSYCGAQVTALAWFYSGLVAEGHAARQDELDGLLHLRTELRAEAIRRGGGALERLDGRSEREIESLSQRIGHSKDSGAQALADLNSGIRSCLVLFFEKEE